MQSFCDSVDLLQMHLSIRSDYAKGRKFFSDYGTTMGRCVDLFPLDSKQKNLVEGVKILCFPYRSYISCSFIFYLPFFSDTDFSPSAPPILSDSSLEWYLTYEIILSVVSFCQNSYISDKEPHSTRIVVSNLLYMNFALFWIK